MVEYIEREKAAEWFMAYLHMGEDSIPADTVISDLKRAIPTADAVPIALLEKWLYEIAMNNVGNFLSDSCEEIIRRLPGLRKFVEDYDG